jgi:hypothetical protein
MAWNVGVLIIGSLYWDTEDGRPEWRSTRLTMESVRAKAPICYGRYSQGRKAYTMVFAPGLPTESYGTARAVQCRGPISAVDGLILEARQLWVAENKGNVPGDNEPQMSADWGCVALIVSPSFLGHPDLTDAEKADRQWTLSFWSEAFCQDWERRKKGKNGSREGASSSAVYAGACAAPVAVDDSGLLQIDWPKSVDGDEPLDGFDLLLATATTPTCTRCTGAYPGVGAVANAWKVNKKELPYFTCNRRHGITTYQDEQIEKLLREPNSASAEYRSHG